MRGLITMARAFFRLFLNQVISGSFAKFASVVSAARIFSVVSAGVSGVDAHAASAATAPSTATRNRYVVIDCMADLRQRLRNDATLIRSHRFCAANCPLDQPASGQEECPPEVHCDTHPVCIQPSSSCNRAGVLADGGLASGPAGTATKVWKRATRRVPGGPRRPFWAPGVCGSGKVGDDEAVIELSDGLRRLS